MHSSACEQHALSLDDLPLTEVPQTDLFTAGRESVLEYIGSFHLRLGGQRRSFICLGQPRAQRVFRADKERLTLGEEVVSSTRAAESSSSPCTLKDSRRLGKRASSPHSRLDHGMGLRTLPHKKRPSSLPHEGCKVMTAVLGSGISRKAKLGRPTHAHGGRKKSASYAENNPTVKRTQAGRQKLRHGKFADSSAHNRLLSTSSAIILLA